MSLKREITVNNPSLMANGLRLEDQMTIYPAMGNRRVIKLDRTLFNITETSIFNIEKDGSEVLIPGASGANKDHFEMFLCPSRDNKILDEDSRYFLRAKGSKPFRINGVYSYGAFVERGDVVDIGYNRIKVNKRATLLQGDYRTAKYLEQSFVESDLNVLIEGETGTGKTRLASLVHEESGRAGRFVHVNLSSFSPNLIESEIFGHVKGSFTGAITDKDGAIYEARGGTLFLDEIDSLPLELQTKLLLFLDNKKVRPVGGRSEREIDVRLVFASGRSLKDLVQKGEFRADFYYRVASGVSLTLPSLRDDSELIKELCEQFCVTENVHISPKLLKFYMSRHWHGNIRELLGHLNKKKILTKGRKLEYSEVDEMLVSHKFSDFVSSDKFYEIATMDEIKKAHFLKVYMKFQGSTEKTAKVLKVSPTTIRNFVKSEKLAS